jgi:hypothetical protein
MIPAYRFDPRPVHSEFDNRAAAQAESETTALVRAIQRQGPYRFWHSALPEVGTFRLRPGVDAVAAQLTSGFKVLRVLAAGALLLALAAPAFATEPACKVNVAACSAAECAYLPGVGATRGAAIAAAHPATEAELDAVPGIGPATLTKLLPFVTYTGETTCTGKQTAPKSEAAKDGAQ